MPAWRMHGSPEERRGECHRMHRVEKGDGAVTRTYVLKDKIVPAVFSDTKNTL